MNHDAVSRWLRCFDKQSDKLLVEYQLPESWTLERLQELLAVPHDNPMYDSYALNSAQARVLCDAVGHDLDAGDMDFFLEADAEE